VVRKSFPFGIACDETFTDGSESLDDHNEPISAIASVSLMEDKMNADIDSDRDMALLTLAFANICILLLISSMSVNYIYLH
jgi:hypothetical protein